jgi:hypothetical protein
MKAGREKQPPEIHDSARLHLEACARLHVLLEECRAFQGAGKVQDARGEYLPESSGYRGISRGWKMVYGRQRRSALSETISSSRPLSG